MFSFDLDDGFYRWLASRNPTLDFQTSDEPTNLHTVSELMQL